MFVLIIDRYYLRQIDLLGIITRLAIITCGGRKQSDGNVYCGAPLFSSKRMKMSWPDQFTSQWTKVILLCLRNWSLKPWSCFQLRHIDWESPTTDDVYVYHWWWGWFNFVSRIFSIVLANLISHTMQRITEDESFWCGKLFAFQESSNLG